MRSTIPKKNVDVIIVGAGAAGLMCAIAAGQRGRKVLLLDHASEIGKKILISGGGRCNFTNLGVHAGAFVSQNPHFCKSALSRFSSTDFLKLVEKHHIPFHEKKLGQLFCDRSARDIVAMLIAECREVGAEFLFPAKIESVQKEENLFFVSTNRGNFTSTSLVIATGGLSIPKIGASGWGYELARKFSIELVPRAAALDGFCFDEALLSQTRPLAGISLDSVVSCKGHSFRENILFTHKGLSGPAALQASLYWNPGDEITIRLLPEIDFESWFETQKRKGRKSELKNLLAELLPDRAAEFFVARFSPQNKRLIEMSSQDLKIFSQALEAWKIIPSRTVGYEKAEVTRGGVSTEELSSQTMEAKKVPGLFFIGEVVDVTGQLGGYNFHWAWASAWAAGQKV